MAEAAASGLASMTVDAAGTKSPAAAAAPAPSAQAAAGKGTAKRDALRSNELAVQAMWERHGAFESDPDPSRPGFLVTFPYPYSNGHLHIGHAFSMTKAVFRAQYERHRGKNVLFPFAFHCTGMPIQAVRLGGGALAREGGG
jgi:leucyl-tRNA synthetase